MTAMDGLPPTPIQKKVLDEYRSRQEDGQAPPTIRELCDRFGWRSTGTARDHIKALERKGLIDRDRGKARGVQVRSTATFNILPFVGRIAAGNPVPSEQDVEDWIPVPGHLGAPEGGFLLGVKGDSMEGVGILDGDLVVVAPTSVPQDGKIFAVTLNGETTLKTLRKRGGSWFLVPENPRYRERCVDSEEHDLHGIVIALLRSYGQ